MVRLHGLQPLSRVAQAAALVTVLAGGVLLAEHVLRFDGSIGNLIFSSQLAATGLPIKQERIGALGQLASGIAHDFNNALGPILG